MVVCGAESRARKSLALRGRVSLYVRDEGRGSSELLSQAICRHASRNQTNYRRDRLSSGLVFGAVPCAVQDFLLPLFALMPVWPRGIIAVSSLDHSLTCYLKHRPTKASTGTTTMDTPPI